MSDLFAFSIKLVISFQHSINKDGYLNVSSATAALPTFKNITTMAMSFLKASSIEPKRDKNNNKNNENKNDKNSS